VAQLDTSQGAYADGAPLDQVQYLEAKLILKPDRFTSVQAFRDFGKIVQRTAKKVGVGFIADEKAGLRPEVREIVFGDTPDFRLYNNAFILRRRIAYVDGFPVGDPEIVFKFRHPDEKQATAMDVRPKIAGAYRIKFKAEALPLKDQVGGYRILYSHNCSTAAKWRCSRRMVSKASAGRADLVLRGYGRPSVHTCDAERAAGQARGKRLACWQSGPPRDFRATGAGRGETTGRDDEALKIKRSFIQGLPGTDSRAQRRGWQNPSKAEVKHEH
jgi:hypothetical protein